MKRIGKNTLEFEMPPTILGHAAIGGKKKSGGTPGADYDQTFQDTTLNTESWEKAEAQLQKEAVALALEKSGFTAGQMDVIFAGGFVEPVYFLPPSACWIFRFLFGAVRSLLHYGANPAAFRRYGGKRSGWNVPWRLPALISALRNASSERPWSMEPSVRPYSMDGHCFRMRHSRERRSSQNRRGLAGKIVDLGVKDAANMGRLWPRQQRPASMSF